MSYQNSRDLAGWTACAPGTLQSLSSRHRTVRRREAVRRVVTPSIVLAVLTVVVWTTSQIMQRSESSYGGVSCADVQANLTVYVAGQLSNELRDKMPAHLRECSYCRSQLRAVSREQPSKVGKTPRYDYSIVASVPPSS